MASHSVHLCPKCSRRFTPKYKVASFKGDKITCPRCLKEAQAPKQAKSAVNLLKWAHEAGLNLHFSKDLGTEHLYVGDGRWKDFDATIDKTGRISINYCRTETATVYDKKQLMNLIQQHRRHINENTPQNK